MVDEQVLNEQPAEQGASDCEIKQEDTSQVETYKEIDELIAQPSAPIQEETTGVSTVLPTEASEQEAPPPIQNDTATTTSKELAPVVPKGTLTCLGKENAENRDNVFDVFIDGVDCRKVYDCPYQFSWRKVGQLQGWKELKKSEMPDGLNVSVNADDNESDDIITNKGLVLCYLEI